jgi:hypothetical protein
MDARDREHGHHDRPAREELRHSDREPEEMPLGGGWLRPSDCRSTSGRLLPAKSVAPAPEVVSQPSLH